MERLKIFGFFLMLAFCIGVKPVKAQLAYGGHLHAVTYLGNLKEYYKGGYGISAQIEYPFSDKVVGVGRTGFLFVPNDLPIDILVFLIPIQLGAKYMLNDKVYAQGMIGLHQVNAVASFGSGSGANFSIGAGLGVQLGKIDISPHIDYVADGWGHIGLRIGYRIEK